MIVNDVEIEETFAEAFPMYVSRLLITAVNRKWATIAASKTVGFATSIIMCPAEGGIEGYVSKNVTPDSRPGVIVQLYHRTIPELKLQLMSRVGQCVLTCPTTALFDALPKTKRRIKLGSSLAKFGDGFEYKREEFGRVMWHIPVMEGEFLIEDSVGVKKGVAGGNIIVLSENLEVGLKAAETAVKAIRKYVRGVVTPFPGGIVRSGSKVGSLKYPKLTATTNHLLCPTLREKFPDSQVPKGVKCVYEIVINGLNPECVMEAMGVAALAATKVKGVKKITSVNFGGKLGPYKIELLKAVEKAKEIVKS